MLLANFFKSFVAAVTLSLRYVGYRANYINRTPNILLTIHTSPTQVSIPMAFLYIHNIICEYNIFTHFADRFHQYEYPKRALRQNLWRGGRRKISINCCHRLSKLVYKYKEPILSLSNFVGWLITIFKFSRIHTIYLDWPPSHFCWECCQIFRELPSLTLYH